MKHLYTLIFLVSWGNTFSEKPKEMLPIYVPSIIEAPILVVNLQEESKSYCKSITGGPDLIRARYSLEYINKSLNQTIILYKKNSNWSRLRIAKSLEDIKASVYEFDLQSTTFQSGESSSSYNLEKPSTDFVILHSGESYRSKNFIEVQTWVKNPNREIKIIESPPLLEKGTHYLQLQLSLSDWLPTGDKGEVFQNSWSKYGVLWFKDITSNPVRIQIDKAFKSKLCEYERNVLKYRKKEEKLKDRKLNIKRRGKGE